MTIQVAYHPGWQSRQRPTRQPVPTAPPNVGPILSLLLAVAMLLMLAILSAGGSMALASAVALPVVLVALSLAFATLFMEVLALWSKTKDYSQFALQ